MRRVHETGFIHGTVCSLSLLSEGFLLLQRDVVFHDVLQPLPRFFKVHWTIAVVTTFAVAAAAVRRRTTLNHI